MTLTLTFISNLITSGTTFSFLVNGIINPPNTTPMNFNNLKIYDSQNYQISEYTSNMIIQTLPTPVATYSLF